MSTQPRRGGTQLGTRHRGKEPQFDPTRGKNYRTGLTLTPDDAVRIIDMAERAGVSVSGMINLLIKTSLINPETDLPFGVAPVTEPQGLFEEAS